jgi:hypothetical protein
VEQRRSFFGIWRNQPDDISLFMRVSTIVTSKHRAEGRAQAEPIEEQTMNRYKMTMVRLAVLNLASDSQYAIVKETIRENNHRILGNRQRCLQCDELITLSHESHADAVDIRDIRPVFRPEESARLFERILRARETLVAMFQPLTLITSIPPGEPNDRAFLRAYGCRSGLANFSAAISECHSRIKADLIRTEVGQDSIAQLDRFQSRAGDGAVQGHFAKTGLRLNPFTRVTSEESRLRPGTGILDKLLMSFPEEGRLKRIIRKSAPKITYQYSNAKDSPYEGETLDLSQTLTPDASLQSLAEQRGAGPAYKGALASFTQLIGESLSTLGKTSSELQLVEDEAETESGRKPDIESRTGRSDGRHDLPPVPEIGTDDDGFDQAILISVACANVVASPRPSKKYQIFLELLFARGARETVQTADLKKRILQAFIDYRAACGVKAVENLRTVTGIMQTYRGDKYIHPAEVTPPPSRPTPEEELTELECRYNSRHLRKMPERQRRIKGGDAQGGSQGGGVTGTGNGEGGAHGGTGGGRRGGGRGGRHGGAQGDGEEDGGDALLGDFSSSSDDDGLLKVGVTAQTSTVGEGTEEGEEGESATVGSDKSRLPPGMTSPFVSSEQAESDHSFISEVNRIAFTILTKQLVDDPTLGALVDVDGDETPRVDFGGDDGIFHTGGKEGRHGPYVRQKHFVPADITRRKGLTPSVSRIQRTPVPSIRQQLSEEAPFAKMIIENGTSYTPSKIPKVRHTGKYRAPLLPKVDDSPWPPDKVVSFPGGDRSYGTESHDFNLVRIAQSKLRAITRPIVPASQPETRPASQAAVPRADLAKEKRIVRELVSMILESDGPKRLEEIRAQLRSIRRNSIGAPGKVFSRIQAIYVHFTAHRDLDETTADLVALARDNRQFATVLVDRIEEVLREIKKQAAEKARQENLDKQQHDVDLTGKYVDAAWMSEQDLKYNAVAICYREPEIELEAVVKRTDSRPVSVESRHRSRPPSRTAQWDDVLQDYGLDELLQVVPYAIPETEVDDALAQLRKNLRTALY